MLFKPVDHAYLKSLSLSAMTFSDQQLDAAVSHTLLQVLRERSSDCDGASGRLRLQEQCPARCTPALLTMIDSFVRAVVKTSTGLSEEATAEASRAAVFPALRVSLARVLGLVSSSESVPDMLQRLEGLSAGGCQGEKHRCDVLTLPHFG